MELVFDREMNLKERLDFIRRYAAWVREVPNSTWSRQQADLIDAFMQNAENYALSRSQYLAIKSLPKIITRCNPLDD